MDELQKILRLTQKSNDVVPVHVKSRSKAVFEKTSSPLPVTETVTEVKVSTSFFFFEKASLSFARRLLSLRMESSFPSVLRAGVALL